MRGTLSLGARKKVEGPCHSVRELTSALRRRFAHACSGVRPAGDGRRGDLVSGAGQVRACAQPAAPRPTEAEEIRGRAAPAALARRHLLPAAARPRLRVRNRITPTSRAATTKYTTGDTMTLTSSAFTLKPGISQAPPNAHLAPPVSYLDPAHLSAPPWPL